jgi:hypothetical protein
LLFIRGGAEEKFDWSDALADRAAANTTTYLVLADLGPPFDFVFFLRSASVSQPPKDSASTARDNILFLLAAGLLSWKLLSFFVCDDGDNGGLPDDVCTYRQVPSHSHTLSAVGERWLAQWSR